ncbi:MAG: imidazolonepropionase, partial [Pseudonocardiaceae bacterium]
MSSTLITGIGELTTGADNEDQMAGSGLALVLDGERVAWVGSARGAPAADVAIDIEGRAVLPGWVDSHTHLVFAGDRA